MIDDDDLKKLLSKAAWSLVDEAQSKRLKNQLTREIPKGHGIYPFIKNLKVVAKAQFSDDIMLTNGMRQFLIVHLTWQDKPSNQKDYPATYFLEGLEQLSDWLEADM